jgi:hypothetical protein
MPINSGARIIGLEKAIMTCTEFQNELPLLIDNGGRPEHKQHLESCEICSDLVNDLRYIADQAKLLVNMEDPSPRVWTGIEAKLKQEGLMV